MQSNFGNAKIELLSPAGNTECLKTAFYFGADAVYLAAKEKSLRAFADNFSFEELKAATEFAHAQKKKIYLTVNAFFHQADFDNFKEFLLNVKACNVDAIILSDLGVLCFVREILPECELHLSTQANTTNSYAINIYNDLGIKRIILARELCLDEIVDIRQKINPQIELEAFVHGAMCISYSGRCLLSGFFTNRSGNSGSCTQPCRWEYYVSERNYEGEYFSVMEDNRGTYIFNSKDLMMIEHIDKLYDAGITSFKIEGRMKSEYYVATAVHAYRRAIDLFLSGKPYDISLTEEAKKAGTREFTTGFFFGNPREAGQSLDADRHEMKHKFGARVLAYYPCENKLLIEQRNKFCVGETLEILSPNVLGNIKVEYILNEQNEYQPSAPHPKQKLLINCNYPLNEGDLLRINSN